MTGLSKNADEFQRNRDLAQLFGRAGQELTNTIMMGGEAFAIFIQKQKELGNIIDGKLITATEQFNDRLSRIGFSLRVVRDSITTAFLPILDDLAEQIENQIANNERKRDRSKFCFGNCRRFYFNLMNLETFNKFYSRNWSNNA